MLTRSSRRSTSRVRLYLGSTGAFQELRKSSSCSNSLNLLALTTKPLLHVLLSQAKVGGEPLIWTLTLLITLGVKIFG
jgi:hypothetical protein